MAVAAAACRCFCCCCRRLRRLTGCMFCCCSLVLSLASNSPTLGGGLLMVSGTNFGLSGSVLIGTRTCVIGAAGTSYGDAAIICSVPAGQGVGLNVTLVGWTQTQAYPVFRYSPPSITYSQSNSGPTTGGSTQLLSIFGANFGLLATVQFIGTDMGIQDCPLSSIGQTDSLIICQVPQGEGRDVPFQVTVSSQVSAYVSGASVYQYDAPVIQAISQLTSPTSGGVMVTIGGVNFGTRNNFSLAIGSFAVPNTTITFFNHTRMAFPAPRGFGANLPFALVVAGQLSTTAVAAGQVGVFSYLPPTITSVSGCTDVGSATTLCGVDGTNILTITGTNFGNLPAALSVTIGSSITSTCAVLAIGTADTRFTCSLGVRPTGGFTLPVTVTLGGQSTTQNYISFAGPIFTPSTITVRSAATQNSQVTATATSLALLVDPTASTSFPVNLTGQFFGSSEAAVTITYGPSDGSIVFPCPLVAGSLFSSGTFSRVSCGVTPGGGSNLVFTIVVGQLTSLASTDTISYPHVSIAPITIRGSLDGNYTAQLTGTNTQGDQVYFDVRHVSLTMASYVSVTYGPSGTGQVCSNPSLQIYNGATTLKCLTAPGVGGPFKFIVTLLNDVSDVGSDVYYYAVAPSVDGRAARRRALLASALGTDRPD